MSGPADLLALLVEEVGRALPPGRALPDVLEVGCGDGTLTARLRDAHPGAALLATDASVRAVGLVAGRGVPARVLDATAMDLSGAAYDVVVAGRLDALGDLDAVLPEVRRVLRGGGSLVGATGAGDAEAHRAALEGRFRRVSRTDVAGRVLLVAR